MKNLLPLIFFLSLLFSPYLPAEEKIAADKIYSAISNDFKYKITHNGESKQLIIQDLESLQVLKTIPTLDKSNKASSISGIRDASTRHSFIISLKDSPEVWEMNYQNPAPPGFGEWVHDYREDSGEATISTFPIRRLMLKIPLDNFFIDEEFVRIYSISCKGQVKIIDLDLGRKVADFNIINNIPEPSKRNETLGLKQVYFQKIQTRATQFKADNCLPNN